MGRPRRYETDAERQAAYRARAAAAALDTLTPLQEAELRKRFGYAPSEERAKRERDQDAERILVKAGLPSESEETYVAREVEITRRQMEAGRLGDHDRKRLERCEAYARWRWREYHAGIVASL